MKSINLPTDVGNLEFLINALSAFNLEGKRRERKGEEESRKGMEKLEKKGDGSGSPHSPEETRRHKYFHFPTDFLGGVIYVFTRLKPAHSAVAWF